MKKAIITGIFGQDGSYLCEYLHSLNYDIHGIVKRDLSSNSQLIKNQLIYNKINPKIHSVDLDNYDALRKVLIEIQPDEIYHLAASHVSSQGVKQNKVLYEKQLFDNNVKATSNILCICFESLKDARVVLAGSCLMYDNSKENIQNEFTAFNSKSLYGLSKITENSLTKYYRNNGFHASMAILYNHESPRRSINFVTKKIVRNMVAIKNNRINHFTLGNIDIKKDWGFAKDYVYGMYLMAQQDCPDDFILSSGELHSIRNILQICADILKINNWEEYVQIDPTILDRKINNQLFGDCTKARQNLRWEKTVNFHELVTLLIETETTECV